MKARLLRPGYGIVFKSMGQVFLNVCLKQILEVRRSQDVFSISLEEDLTTVPGQPASQGQQRLKLWIDAKIL